MSRRGENIYKRKDGRWEGRYIKSRQSGRAKYGYVYARTYRDVKRKLALQQTAGETEYSVLPLSQKKFRFIGREWLASLTPRLKESSIIRYDNLLKKYLYPEFGDCLIGSITNDDIEAFCNRLLMSGGQREQGLSPKMVSSILSVLKSIFRYASPTGVLLAADARSISIRQGNKPMRILSLAEQQKLSDYLCENRTYCNLGILLCLYTGLRVGEVCALKWEDIDIEDQSLYIHRTLQRIQNSEADSICKTKIVITEPKSNCSNRRIPVPDNVFKLLMQARGSSDAFFLTGSDKCFVEPRTMQNNFKRAVNACGIEKVSFHTLRHTFATRCVELGFDVKSLSEILGHASVNITMNRYVHPSMELKQENMNKLSRLLNVK